MNGAGRCCVIRIGADTDAGKAAKKFASACTPPVDDPMPIQSTRRSPATTAGGRAVAAATGAGSGAARAIRRSLTHSSPAKLPAKTF